MSVVEPVEKMPLFVTWDITNHEMLNQLISKSYWGFGGHEPLAPHGDIGGPRLLLGSPSPQAWSLAPFILQLFGSV